MSPANTDAFAGVGHRLVHRLKPVSDSQNPLKRVGRASSALQRTLAISRRFESAGLAETTTIARLRKSDLFQPRCAAGRS
jgi:hypothetical protein